MMELPAPTPRKVAGHLQAVPSSEPTTATPLRLHRSSDSPKLDAELLRIAHAALNDAAAAKAPTDILREFAVRIRHDDAFIGFASHFQFIRSDIEKIATLNLFKINPAASASSLSNALEHQSRHKNVIPADIDVMRFYQSLYYLNPLAAEAYASALKIAPHLNAENIFRNIAQEFNIIDMIKSLPVELFIEYFNLNPLMDGVSAFPVEGFVGIRRVRDVQYATCDYAAAVLPIADFSRFVLCAYLDPRLSVLQMIRKHAAQNARCATLINTYMAYHDAEEGVLTQEIQAAVRGKPAFVSKPVFMVAAKRAKPSGGAAPELVPEPPPFAAPKPHVDDKSRPEPQTITRQGSPVARSAVQQPQGKRTKSHDAAASLTQRPAVATSPKTETTASPKPSLRARWAALRLRTRIASVSLLAVLLLATTAAPLATSRYDLAHGWPLRQDRGLPTITVANIAQGSAYESVEPAGVPVAALQAPEEAKALEAPVAPLAPVTAPASTLTLSARGDVWVQVTQAQTGQTVLTRLLRAGETRIVPVQPGLTLTVGAAQHLSVSVDGRDIRLDAFLRRGIIRGVRLEDIIAPATRQGAI